MQKQEFSVDPLLHNNSADETVTMTLNGALRPISETQSSEVVPTEIKETLTDWLNRPADIEESAGNPQVAPPLYGRWQAGIRRVNETNVPLWFNELNLDPRNRIAAAAGGDIVQEHQDEFIKEAWLQAGQLKEVNKLLSAGQMARGTNYHLKLKHFLTLSNDHILQVGGPYLSRIRSQTGNTTVYKAVETSDIPEAGFEGAFRRIARIRGPHFRRWTGAYSYYNSSILFQQGFKSEDLSNWTVVDQGTVFAPSKWTNNFGIIEQKSNICSEQTDRESLSKYGTMYIAGDTFWRDIRFSVTVSSGDNDAVGIVFRYRNSSNYYRFSMDSERKYRRLVKCTNGTFTKLWEDSFSFTPNY